MSEALIREVLNKCKQKECFHFSNQSLTEGFFSVMQFFYALIANFVSTQSQQEVNDG